MSTTATTNEAFAKPDVGTEENSWGALLNTIFDLIDVRLGGKESKSVAGSSDVTLTAAEARSPIQIYTGALTGAINVIVPTNNRTYFVYNNTSGSFSLTVKTSAGTGIAVPQGGRIALLCDGTDVVRAFDATGTGLLAAASDLSDVAAAATAFANIKQAATASATGVVELATNAEVTTGTDTERAVTPAGAAAATVYQGEHAAPITANFLRPTTTNGCGDLATAETTSNVVNYSYRAFDTATQEYAYCWIKAPKSADETTGIYVKNLAWAHPATATNFGVVWQVQMLAVGNDDALDAAYGTEQTITDTGGTTEDIYIAPDSSAITPAGSWAENDWLLLRIGRKVADASDDLAVDAHLIGFDLIITTNAKNDA